MILFYFFQNSSYSVEILGDLVQGSVLVMLGREEGKQEKGEVQFNDVNIVLKKKMIMFVGYEFLLYSVIIIMIKM